MPYQILFDWAIPQPLNMMSRIPCTASVCGNILATVIIHCRGIPSSGQMMPQSNMWGKQDPMESLIASMELLQTVERKNPKLIPAKPYEENMSDRLWLENMLYEELELTLEQSEYNEPCNWAVTGNLKYDKHCYQCYCGLK